LIFRRGASLWTWIGVALAFVGLYFLTIPGGAGVSLASLNLGDLLTLACAVAFAFQIISVGHATSHDQQGYPFEHIAFVQVATAAVLMAISFPLLEHPHVVWSAAVIWAIMITGILATAVAFSIQAWSQQFLPSTHTALIFALEPVFASLTSWLLLHEHLGSRALLGGALILSGIVMAEVIGARSEQLSPA